MEDLVVMQRDLAGGQFDIESLVFVHLDGDFGCELVHFLGAAELSPLELAHECPRWSTWALRLGCAAATDVIVSIAGKPEVVAIGEGLWSVALGLDRSSSYSGL